MAVLSAIEIIPPDDAAATVALGELSLNGDLVPVHGALPAAMAAAVEEKQLLCPKACGPEAAWVGNARVIAPNSLAQLIQHFTGQSVLANAQAGEVKTRPTSRDLADVKGQERAKRALEIAAAGRHHMFLVGPPGSGKSMLAARLPSILPPLTPPEALETSMIHSVSGLLDEGGINRERPFREPHHTASMAAIVGGGRGAKPGEISLVHNGVLFMDEFPEFSRTVLETLRQPIETGKVVVARANAHIKYPCPFIRMRPAIPPAHVHARPTAVKTIWAVFLDRLWTGSTYGSKFRQWPLPTLICRKMVKARPESVRALLRRGIYKRNAMKTRQICA